MARIDDLVYHLKETGMYLKEACFDLGFDSEDLTINELKELKNWFFRCGNCSEWYDKDDECANLDGNICIYCASECYEEY